MLKTKHKALNAHGLEILVRCESGPESEIKVYYSRQHNIDRLRNAIGFNDWNSLISSNDIDYIYSNFVTSIHECIATTIPIKLVKMVFVTLLLLLLLLKAYLGKETSTGKWAIQFGLMY